MSRAQLTSTVEQNSAGVAAPVVAGKNVVANSDFSIWQRGTSVSVAASTTSAYTADRWTIQTNASQACTVQRMSTSDTTNLPNIQYCARIQRNAGQTGTAGITFLQPIETVSAIPFAGKTVVLSFYARCGANFSATNNYMNGIVYSGTGTDQNPFTGYTGVVQALGTTFALTTTWQRFTVTSATIPSNATELSVLLNYNPTGTAGANDYVEVTGVQLELGSVPTPFSRAGGTVQGELALCQRYYLDLAKNGAGYGYPTSYSTGSASSYTATVNAFPVEMRVAPTLSVTDIANLAGKISTYNTTLGRTDNVTPNTYLYPQGFGFGTSQTGTVLIGGNKLQFSAEL